MNYRRLERANLDVSEISFGCMSLGVNHAENETLIHTAFDAGVNYFDTADIYKNGFNEETVGRALKPIRKEVVLASKVGNVPNDEERNWEWNPSKSYILSAVEKSLKRLGTDYIDIYQLHGGMIEDNWEETIEAFELLKERGLIRHYGISSIRPNVIRRFAQHSQVVSNMIQYSLLDRRPEEEALEVLSKAEIGVMVRGGLAGGLLAGKDSSDYLNYTTKEIELLVDKIKSFSIEKISLAQASLQWVLSNKAVTTAVVGMRNMEQLQDVLGTIKSAQLTDEMVTELSALLEPNVYTKHR
ncbi:aldo/keto reductase [Roseivirga sp. E12]|uniref:aldo/keto reductase n=1 Tax=Roseivirga sp. E12 TaxID=2819237 RepID=UPI001ABCD160|nr:aldo/keto reductase [Roseivirga sp. E12]MBO3700586.1 aldo/keto reductase [Roseivirga sp. E12]